MCIGFLSACSQVLGLSTTASILSWIAVTFAAIVVVMFIAGLINQQYLDQYYKNNKGNNDP